jgi:misacylated tRNA(Ala) deacylase
MTRTFCQDHPDIFELKAAVIETRPGAVLLDRSPAFPGGGGQLPDRATILWSGGELAINRVSADPRGIWHEFDGPAEPAGEVLVKVDWHFRELMCELHTLAHVVNSLVYTAFGGALLTGAQLSEDATFRVDFDLPGADNDRLRALERPINDIIRQDLKVHAAYMPWAEAQAIPGMFRSKSVAPPAQDDGMVRIVEIADLDRQACGGTHLASTGAARPAKILKIDNKGRQNRRLRIGLVGLSA